MKVEIWSDVVCPFCYIGKRKFEKALQAFAHRDEVEVVWRSFELNPDLTTTPGETSYQSLARHKGIAEAEARRMSTHVTEAAREVGLRYDFDKAVPANTFLAHQLIHFGEAHGRQDATKERLLAAYYTEGQDIGDPETLGKLAAEVGLDPAEARAALQAGTYAGAVRHDEEQARQVGVRGVPFFVFEDKYAVSGAQPSEVFSEVLGTVWNEFRQQYTVFGDGAACGPAGCD